MFKANCKIFPFPQAVLVILFLVILCLAVGLGIHYKRRRDSKSKSRSNAHLLMTSPHDGAGGDKTPSRGGDPYLELAAKQHTVRHA